LLACWLVGWLLGWLVGWLVDLLYFIDDSSESHPLKSLFYPFFRHVSFFVSFFLQFPAVERKHLTIDMA